MEAELVGRLIFYVVVLLFAVSAHEAAHAWTSYKFGDDTAYLLGRVTLNPVAHTDPIGTLLIPIINFIGAHAGVFVPLIGWGKPTPVNPLRWRNKDAANIMVSLAGIIVNVLIACGALLVIKVLQAVNLLSTGAQYYATGSLAKGTMNETLAEPVSLLLTTCVGLNASLAVFNLLPVPPLDGSKVLYSILPSGAHGALDALEQYGFILLIAAIYFGLVAQIFAPVARFIELLLTF